MSGGILWSMRWRIESELQSFYRCFFFFSSRRRHTRYIGDWSSDVCSSDLFFRYIFKLSLTLVAQQLHAVAQAYRKIGLPVIVKIARSAAESAARKTNARRLRYILKSPVAQVAQQMARPIRRAVHEKEIRLAIAVKVKKTRARACSDGHRDSTAAF